MLIKLFSLQFLIAFCMSLNGALYLIWMEVVMELPEYSSRLMLIYYVVSVFGLAVWRNLSLKHQSILLQVLHVFMQLLFC